MKACNRFPELRDLGGLERIDQAKEHLKGCEHCRKAVMSYHNGSLDKEIERHAHRITGVARLRGSERSLTHAVFKRYLEVALEDDKRAMLLLFKHPASRHTNGRSRQRAGMERHRFEGMMVRG